MSSAMIEDLVNSAKNGNAEAFGELYGIYALDMYRFAYYYVGSSQTAEDCVGDAVCAAFEKIRDLKKADAFKSWLFKILRNCCNAALRDKKQSAANVEFTLMRDLQAPESDSSESLSLKGALRELADDEREIITLYFSCGYTSKEISQITGINHATVRSKIKRGTEKLRKKLEI